MRRIEVVLMAISACIALEPLQGAAGPGDAPKWGGDAPFAQKWREGVGAHAGLGKALPWLNKGMAGVKPAKGFRDSFERLDKGDEKYEEDYVPKGMPRVPSNCLGSSKCASCFEPAYDHLNRVRSAFERLRRIYTSTKEFKDQQIAFGDSVSGVHGVAGLGWFPERVKIEQSFTRFQGICERKREELLGELEKALNEIAECEEKVYGEKDWFPRFGFMYYQFVEMYYKTS